MFGSSLTDSQCSQVSAERRGYSKPADLFHLGAKERGQGSTATVVVGDAN